METGFTTTSLNDNANTLSSGGTNLLGTSSSLSTSSSNSLFSGSLYGSSSDFGSRPLTGNIIVGNRASEIPGPNPQRFATLATNALDNFVSIIFDRLNEKFVSEGGNTKTYSVANENPFANGNNPFGEGNMPELPARDFLVSQFGENYPMPSQDASNFLQENFPDGVNYMPFGGSPFSMGGGTNTDANSSVAYGDDAPVEGGSNPVTGLYLAGGSPDDSSGDNLIAAAGTGDLPTSADNGISVTDSDNALGGSGSGHSSTFGDSASGGTSTFGDTDTSSDALAVSDISSDALAVSDTSSDALAVSDTSSDSPLAVSDTSSDSPSGGGSPFGGAGGGSPFGGGTDGGSPFGGGVGGGSSFGGGAGGGSPFGGGAGGGSPFGGGADGGSPFGGGASGGSPFGGGAGGSDTNPFAGASLTETLSGTLDFVLDLKGSFDRMGSNSVFGGNAGNQSPLNSPSELLRLFRSDMTGFGLTVESFTNFVGENNPFAGTSNPFAGTNPFAGDENQSTIQQLDDRFFKFLAWALDGLLPFTGTPNVFQTPEGELPLGYGNRDFGSGNVAIGNANRDYGTNNGSIGNNNWNWDNATGNATIGNGNWNFSSNNKTVGNGNWNLDYSSDNKTFGNGNWNIGSDNSTLGNGNYNFGNNNLVIGNGNWVFTSNSIVIGNGNWSVVLENTPVNQLTVSSLLERLNNLALGAEIKSVVDELVDSTVKKMGNAFYGLTDDFDQAQKDTFDKVIRNQDAVTMENPFASLASV